MGKSRRFDGKPETPKDKRFFDLRESGYRGPIDQDGDPARVTRSGRIAKGKRFVPGRKRGRG